MDADVRFPFRLPLSAWKFVFVAFYLILSSNPYGCVQSSWPVCSKLFTRLLVNTELIGFHVLCGRLFTHVADYEQPRGFRALPSMESLPWRCRLLHQSCRCPHDMGSWGGLVHISQRERKGKAFWLVPSCRLGKVNTYDFRWRARRCLRRARTALIFWRLVGNHNSPPLLCSWWAICGTWGTLYRIGFRRETSRGAQRFLLLLSVPSLFVALLSISRSERDPGDVLAETAAFAKYEPAGTIGLVSLPIRRRKL